MGNLQSCSLLDEEEEQRLIVESSLTQEYREATFVLIEECHATMAETYGRCWFTLTKEQFETVFSLAFDDTEKHFDLWRTDGEDGETPVANVFQVFCALFLLCEEELRGLDNKVSCLVKLFDFDGSETLNRVELECLFTAAVEGVAKATATRACTKATLSALVDELFPKEEAAGKAAAAEESEVAADAAAIAPNNGEVTLLQLKHWAAGCAAVDSYLLHFARAHLVVHYQRQVEEAFSIIAREFVNRAAPGFDPPRITLETLASIIMRTNPLEEEEDVKRRRKKKDAWGSPATEEELAVFISHGDDEDRREGGLVGFDEFSELVLPWIGFSVVDSTLATGSLSRSELKILIWISDGEECTEPSVAVVDQAERAIDFDHDGMITRSEWLDYNSAYDPTTGSRRFLKAASKQLFNIDVDTAGVADNANNSIPTAEIRDIFVGDLVQMVNHINQIQEKKNSSKKELLLDIIRTAASEVLDLIDVNHDGFVTWDEFARTRRQVAEKQNQIRHYAKVLFKDDDTPALRREPCKIVEALRGKRQGGSTTTALPPRSPVLPPRSSLTSADTSSSISSSSSTASFKMPPLRTVTSAAHWQIGNGTATTDIKTPPHRTITSAAHWQIGNA